MQSSTCKCGETRWYHSGMPPKDCEGCKYCGTNAKGEPTKAHTPTNEKVVRDGKEVSNKTYCEKCYQRIDRERS